MEEGMQKPKLCVVVPVYNCADLIGNCVKSLERQTYENVEIILVDDGSTDDSGQLCDVLAKTCRNVRVIHQENGGVSNARNAGILSADGEYLHLCDSDDWLEPEAYEEILSRMESEQADVALFGWYVDMPDGRAVPKTANAFDGTGTQDQIFSGMLCMTGDPGGNRGYGNYVWNKVYRRSKLNDRTGKPVLFDPTVQIAEDGLWLVYAAQNWEKGVFLKKPYYHYTLNPNSTMNKPENYTKTRLASQDSHIKMLDVLRAYNDSYFRIHRDVCTKYFWMTVKSPKGRDPEFIQKVLENITEINDGKCPEAIKKEGAQMLARAEAGKEQPSDAEKAPDRIGILTFHRAINYGALLQCYALQEKLRELGTDVKVIDYRSPFLESAYRLTWDLQKNKWSSIWPWLNGVPSQIRKKRRFRRFAAKHLHLTEPYEQTTIPRCENSFKGIITGSDQVWNMTVCGNDYSFLLDFVKDNGKKLSYAVSMGSYQPSEEEMRMIGSFRSVSLREKNACSVISRQLGRAVHADLDPTLLLDREQWEKVVAKRQMKKPYVFIYSVYPQYRMVKYAKKLAKEKGLEIVHLHNRVKKAIREDGVHLLFDCSPEQFLSWIRHADYVLSNSFHGTVFSILFERQFLSELETRVGYNNRVWELLRMLGLERRILDRVPGINDGVSPEESIDWKSVEEKLIRNRAVSEEYLRSICKED